MNNLRTSDALSSREESFAIRFDAISSLEAGILELEDFFDSATTSDGRALAKIKLRRLLEALPGWTPSDAASVLDGMIASLGMEHSETDRSALTLRWLLDKRTGGNRWRAFWASKITYELAKTADDGAAKPWAGFPFAARPEED